LSGFDDTLPTRNQVNDSCFRTGNDRLLKNSFGQWELYISGDPLQRGLKTGLMTKELLEKQESYFFSNVTDIIPSKSKQALLRRFLAYFNRKMYRYIDNEFKAEIYGLSQYAGHDYDYLADPYMRILYLHGAHDIGHAVQGLALVGCTSFAVWDDHSADGKLLLGRNFDFYAGDDFAKEKVIAFIDPERGNSFMSVTWAGMMGVVSGMNEKGMTVTINAGHSKIPFSAKTPISILTREILQYASNLDEALAIAKTRRLFVSESIMVGSATDHKAIIIEVSPDKLDVYEVQNTGELICSNHFQSELLADQKENKEHMEESHSVYRYERMTELLAENKKVDPLIAAEILRTRTGLQDKAIGNGNEKSLNQLLAHHSVIFQPEDLKVWVSSNPYQLGEYVAYDLHDIFNVDHTAGPNITSANTLLTIPEDPFLHSQEFSDYEQYRRLRRILLKSLEDESELANPGILEELTQLNPEYYEAYYLVALYQQEHDSLKKALTNFKTAASKEVTTLDEKEDIAKRIKKLERKLK